MPILSKIFRTNLNITQSRNLNYKNVQLIQQNQKKQDEITYLRQITPEKYYPYIKLGRYEKQIGSILLFWPFAWGAASALTSFNLSLLATKLGYCYIASVTLRSAGCAINDYWDQDFDKKVERTKDRPLAKGELSFYQALGFCIANTIVGCGSLLQLGIYPLSIGLMATPFVILYPLMKRITNYPQLFLGITFNWGAVIGYASIGNCIEPSIIVPIYLTGVLWTLIYDTIYAHQDKYDDIKIGVKSTALQFNENTIQIAQILNLINGCLLITAGINAGFSLIIFAPMVGVSSAYLQYLIKICNINDRESCNKFFKTNQRYGALVFISILTAKYFENL